jgi:hypothetical protein
MSCTILTVPFDLVENEKGEFLKKGFVIDQQLQKKFGDPKHHRGYLYSAKFKEDTVRKTLIKAFLQLEDSPHFKINTELDSDYSFVDRKKYANTIEGHCVNILDSSKSETPSTDYLARLLDRLDGERKLLFRTNLPAVKNQFFTIESVSVFLNRQNSAKGVGYGFISIALNWENEIGESTPIPELSTVREFLRYFGAEPEKNTFVPIFHGTLRTGEKSSKAITSSDEDQINYLKSKLPRLKTEYPTVFNSVEVPEDAYLKSNVNFFSLFDELLKSFLPSSTQEPSFYKFKDDIKPYLLHLDDARNLTSENDRDTWMKSIYHVLRIPGQERKPIFNEFNYSPIMADDSSLFYCLNEGAYIMDGSHPKADKAMVNVYFPAFLMALNQKFLFDYFQYKISELSLYGDNHFDGKELNRLKANLVKTEFRQVFFNVSNYHEISEFYHAVQSKFKIKELRDEYIASIEAINELVKLAENKAKETEQKAYEEQKEKQENRLNTILLALTIYQVWFGICGVGIYPLNKSWIIVTGFIIITALFMAKTEVRDFLFTSINPIKKKS